MKYKVFVRLEGEYEDIEADNPEEAFIMASDFAIGGGDWMYDVVPLEEDGDSDDE